MKIFPYNILLYVGFISATPSVCNADMLTFFGEDMGLGANTALASTPNSDGARSQFISRLTGFDLEDFEGFNDGDSAPQGIDFATVGNAVIDGDGKVQSVPSGTNGSGLYPISGDNYWKADTNLTIDFANPISAFGFYGIDASDFDGKLTIRFVSGASTIVNVNNSMSAPEGSALFYGFINTEDAFSRIEFGTTNAHDNDYFAIDDLHVAALNQVAQSFNSLPPKIVAAPDNSSALALFGMGLLGCLGLARKARPAVR